MSVLKIDDVDVFRNNIRGKLNGILQNEKNSANLEKGIFNYALKEADQHKVVKKWDNKRFVQIYVDRLRSIYTNLSSEVVAQINDETIKPHMAAFMTHQELCPKNGLSLLTSKLSAIRINLRPLFRHLRMRLLVVSVKVTNVLTTRCKQGQPTSPCLRF